MPKLRSKWLEIQIWGEIFKKINSRKLQDSPIRKRMKEGKKHVFQKKKLTNIKENGIFQKNSPPTKKQRTNPKERRLVMVSLRICKRTDRIPQSISLRNQSNRIVNVCNEESYLETRSTPPLGPSSFPPPRKRIENKLRIEEDRSHATRFPRVYGGN